MILIFGNSGSGKSTLAQRLAQAGGLGHLDLDTIAWQPTVPPQRRPLADSVAQMMRFFDTNANSVVEGCYADLLAEALPRCTQMFFLNPGVQVCVENARARPWEPHKYSSPEAQNKNLELLIAWIRDYEARRDVFSLAAHRALFDGFSGQKRELKTREEISAVAWPDRDAPR
mgnify:CR=1 FL=1